MKPSSFSTRTAQLALAALVSLGAALQLSAQAPAPKPLSLGEAVRLAASQNAGVEVARFRASQADARVRERRADLLPSLSAAAIQSQRTQNTATFGFDFKGPTGESFFKPEGQVLGPIPTLDLRARLSQSVLDLGANERVRAASAAAEAGDAETATASELAAGNAAVAYLRAVRASAQLSARQADSVLAAELLEIAQDQLRAGVGIALDVTRARSQAAQIRAQLIGARAERDRATVDLARVLSLPVNTPLVLTDSLSGLATDVAGTETEAVGRAIGGRPELKSIEAQLTSVTRAENAIRRERFPTVSAFADNGPIARNGRSYINTYTWGLQLTVPIFDGFRREARVQEQEALRREYDVRRRDLEQQVTLDVRAAQLDIGAAREQLAAARERLSLADQELSQARDRFRAGVAGNADVVTASLGLNAARTLVVDAQAGFQSARIALARAQGQARSIQ
ncbi:MAG: TolC family protein [Gemmatimonadaceae bacterium]